MSPASMRSFMRMIVTPVSRSPRRIAHWIGAAPRYCGSSDACTLMQPRRGSSRIGARQDAPVGGDDDQVGRPAAQQRRETRRVCSFAGCAPARRAARRAASPAAPAAAGRARPAGRAGRRRRRPGPARRAAPAATARRTPACRRRRCDSASISDRADEHEPRMHADRRPIRCGDLRRSVASCSLSRRLDSRRA